MRKFEVLLQMGLNALADAGLVLPEEFEMAMERLKANTDAKWMQVTVPVAQMPDGNLCYAAFRLASTGEVIVDVTDPGKTGDNCVAWFIVKPEYLHAVSQAIAEVTDE